MPNSRDLVPAGLWPLHPHSPQVGPGQGAGLRAASIRPGSMAELRSGLRIARGRRGGCGLGPNRMLSGDEPTAVG